jgi:hypothetical protein
MKIYLVKRKKTNVRWFSKEEDLTDFLINAPERPDSYKVTAIDATPKYEMNGGEILEKIKERNKLDLKVNSTLGDEYSSKVHKLIQMYESLAKRTPWDKTRMTESALKVYEKMLTTPAVEKDFKKLGSSNIRYLLYCVSDSVEWYKSLLDVYPSIKKLDETCNSEYIDPVTYGTSWNGHRTPERMIKNFDKAKNSKK